MPASCLLQTGNGKPWTAVSARAFLVGPMQA
jgi:hypothetical protein